MTMTRKRKRHTPEQIIKKLGDTDKLLNAGKSLGEVLQRAPRSLGCRL